MVQLTQSDLQFLFNQVTFDNNDLESPSDFSGIREVGGQGNNRLPGQESFGSADLDFIRLADVKLRPGYHDYSDGLVTDPTPRVISNIIADQTGFVPNAPAVAGALPFNGWMTLFGQFFDHGLDFIGKGEQGAVMVPLLPGDPLYSTAPGANNFMIVSRANVSNLAEAGADQIFGTPDDVGYSNNGTPGDTTDDTFAAPRHINHPSPFVDQNQTYGSHPTIKALMMEYDENGVATGKLVGGANGLATWADIKANAAKIGLTLTNQDVSDAPLLRTNPDGSIFRNAAGDVEVVMQGGNVVRSGHAFLLDIHPLADPTLPGHEAQLDAHFVTGDGRVNENYGLTAVHSVFHSEHNHIVDQIKALLAQPGQTISMTGEQIFEAAKLVTEMEYQHIVFDEFVVRITPNLVEFSGDDYDTTINAAISTEFSQAIYRLGHSMLRETIDTIDPTTGVADSDPLVNAFLNPAGFAAAGGAGAIALGMTFQTGNEIDEFVTDALRNNLLGLPLDLAAINIARGRDVGLPTLNEFRQQLFAAGGNAALAPYTSWTDFGAHMNTPGNAAGGSLLNFITAYAFSDVALAQGVPAARAQAQAAMATAGFMNGTLATTHALYDESQAFWDIDLWIGGLAERKVTGGLLGSTFDAVFANQMQRLQNGDRFYYLARLSEENIMQEIESENFADLIMRNSSATYLNTDTFGVAQARIILTDNADMSGADRSTFALSEIVGGGEGNDNIQGGAGTDSLYGDGGADTLNGGAGDDFLTGGDGDDRLTDTSGSNLMRGGAGNDILTGGSGRGFLHGGSGNDILSAGGNKDELFGGIGDDVARGGGGQDKVAGGEGNDTLYGDAGIDELLGDQGNDTLFGGAGRDVVDGGDGNDILSAGAGGSASARELIDGDKGFDFASYQDAASAVTADLANISANRGDAQYDRYIDVEGLIGSDFNDRLLGNGRANELRGGDGADNLNGRGGADTLNGGAGNDVLNGGGGNDVFVFGAGFGNDRISGFDSNPTGGQGRLDVRALGITAASFGAEVAIAQSGANTLVTTDEGSILLLNVNQASVTQADFLLL